MIAKLRSMILRIRISRFLVENWRDFYKWLSVQMALVLIALDYFAQYVPEINAALPERWARYMGMVILIARILKGWGKRNEPVSTKQ